MNQIDKIPEGFSLGDVSDTFSYLHDIDILGYRPLVDESNGKRVNIDLRDQINRINDYWDLRSDPSVSQKELSDCLVHSLPCVFGASVSHNISSIITCLNGLDLMPTSLTSYDRHVYPVIGEYAYDYFDSTHFQYISRAGLAYYLLYASAALGNRGLDEFFEVTMAKGKSFNLVKLYGDDYVFYYFYDESYSFASNVSDCANSILAYIVDYSINISDAKIVVIH